MGDVTIGRALAIALADPAFMEVLMVVAANAELVREFDRLYGSNLSRRGTPLELEIDDATGRTNADLGAFVAFVYECVWLRVAGDSATGDGGAP